MSNPVAAGRRPVALRRSWLFAGGAEEAGLRKRATASVDVPIHELEDFTTPAQRPAARALIPALMRAWRDGGRVAAVRINPLETADGPKDLAACFADPARGVPDAILMPKVAVPAQIDRLDAEVTRLEAAAGLPEGSVELVPNIEGARGLMHTYAIATASPRVTACLVASEDMAADLGAERGRDGRELSYVRERFHLECRAAGVISIDCPYTFTDIEGLEAETRDARRLGMTAKSCIRVDHAERINTVLTPDAEAVAHARRVIAVFEEAQAKGLGTVELDGVNLELPIVLNARRLVERADAFAAYA
jgi:citrate lyase subunit beta/citryl-CoA lyase